MSLPVKHLETVLKLLAEPNRLRILYSLGLDCRPVTQIVKDTGLSQTNVSFHLRLLREAGLVRPERRGAFIYYCLWDAELLDVLGRLGDWLKQQRSAGRTKLKGVEVTRQQKSESRSRTKRSKQAT